MQLVISLLFFHLCTLLTASPSQAPLTLANAIAIMAVGISLIALTINARERRKRILQKEQKIDDRIDALEVGVEKLEDMLTLNCKKQEEALMSHVKDNKETIGVIHARLDEIYKFIAKK